MEDCEFRPRYQYFDMLFRNRIIGIIFVLLTVTPIIFTYYFTKSIQLSSWALVLLFGFLSLLSDMKRKIVLNQDGTIRVTGFLGISKTIPVGQIIYYDLSRKRYLMSGYLLDAHKMLNEETLHNMLSAYAVTKNTTFCEYEDHDATTKKKLRNTIISLLIVILFIVANKLPVLRPVMENSTAIISCLFLLYLLIKTIIVLPKARKKDWEEACETARYAQMHKTSHKETLPIHKWPE